MRMFVIAASLAVACTYRPLGVGDPDPGPVASVPDSPGASPSMDMLGQWVDMVSEALDMAMPMADLSVAAAGLCQAWQCSPGVCRPELVCGQGACTLRPCSATNDPCPALGLSCRNGRCYAGKGQACDGCARFCYYGDGTRCKDGACQAPRTPSSCTGYDIEFDGERFVGSNCQIMPINGGHAAVAGGMEPGTAARPDVLAWTLRVDLEAQEAMIGVLGWSNALAMKQLKIMIRETEWTARVYLITADGHVINGWLNGK